MFARLIGGLVTIQVIALAAVLTATASIGSLGGSSSEARDLPRRVATASPEPAPAPTATRLTTVASGPRIWVLTETTWVTPGPRRLPRGCDEAALRHLLEPTLTATEACSPPF